MNRTTSFLKFRIRLNDSLFCCCLLILGFSQGVMFSPPKYMLHKNLLKRVSPRIV